MFSNIMLKINPSQERVELWKLEISGWVMMKAGRMEQIGGIEAYGDGS